MNLDYDATSSLLVSYKKSAYGLGRLDVTDKKAQDLYDAFKIAANSSLPKAAPIY